MSELKRMKGEITMEEAKVCACESKPNSKLRQILNHIRRTLRNFFRLHRKSNMQSWAEREIEIACQRERADSGVKKGWDYGCACYSSALKAYKSLMGDGHSGFSIGMTKHILNRLIEGRPLTPIEDTDDVWNGIGDRDSHHLGEVANYQCSRMSALFKYVYADGSVKYRDIDSAYCVNITNGSTYHSGLVQREIVDKMFPVTMPYMPGEPIKIFCDDLLTDPKNGDFDTVAVFYAVKPDGEKIEVNRFFKEAADGWAEIDGAEYALRQEMEARRKGADYE